jgi:hypothetical protein
MWPETWPLMTMPASCNLLLRYPGWNEAWLGLGEWWSLGGHGKRPPLSSRGVRPHRPDLGVRRVRPCGPRMPASPRQAGPAGPSPGASLAESHAKQPQPPRWRQGRAARACCAAAAQAGPLAPRRSARESVTQAACSGGPTGITKAGPALGTRTDSESSLFASHIRAPLPAQPSLRRPAELPQKRGAWTGRAERNTARP